MTSRSNVTQTVTSNSQYGQWFDATRRLTSPSVARYFNVTPSRQHQHSMSAIARSQDHSHTSRDQLLSRDQAAVTSSRDDSSPVCASDSRQLSWRPPTLPLSLQRSSTTLGRFSTSVSGVDSLPSQSHADLIRDYGRYRQIQAGLSNDEPVWRATGRLLTRQTSAVSTAPGQTASIANVQSTATTTSSVDTEQPRPIDTQTTVVPLQLRVAGPTPLQRSVADVVSSRRLPADLSMRRTHTGRPLSSLVTSDTSVLTHQLNSPAQVYF